MNHVHIEILLPPLVRPTSSSSSSSPPRFSTVWKLHVSIWYLNASLKGQRPARQGLTGRVFHLQGWLLDNSGIGYFYQIPSQSGIIGYWNLDRVFVEVYEPPRPDFLLAALRACLTSSSWLFIKYSNDQIRFSWRSSSSRSRNHIFYD